MRLEEREKELREKLLNTQKTLDILYNQWQQVHNELYGNSLQGAWDSVDMDYQMLPKWERDLMDKAVKT